MTSCTTVPRAVRAVRVARGCWRGPPATSRLGSAAAAMLWLFALSRVSSCRAAWRPPPWQGQDFHRRFVGVSIGGYRKGGAELGWIRFAPAGFPNKTTILPTTKADTSTPTRSARDWNPSSRRVCRSSSSFATPRYLAPPPTVAAGLQARPHLADSSRAPRAPEVPASA